jgi:hypothetical protein
MKNQVIEVLNVEHGKKVIEYWKSRGFDTRDYWGEFTKEDDDVYRYYGVINGTFNNYSLEEAIKHNAEIITLSDEKTFPRKMLVWDYNEGDAVERMVLWINTFGKSICPIVCVDDCSEINFNKGEEYYTRRWKHAKELPEVKELTIEEAAKKLSEVFGMDVKIKDERIA